MALIRKGGYKQGLPNMPVPKPPIVKAPKRPPMTAPPQAFFGPITTPTPPNAPQRPPRPPTPPGGPGAAGSSQDPFAFIQSMMQTTDPAAARAIIDQIYAPSRQAIQDQIQETQGMAQARAQQYADVWKEFGGFLQGLPAAQGGSSDARTQGMKDGAALASGMLGPVGEVSSHLDALASASSSMSTAATAAWADYYKALPGVYALAATQQVKQILGDAGVAEDKLRQDLLSLNSQEATAVLNYITQAQQQDNQLRMWAFGQQTSISKAKATAASQAAATAEKIREFNAAQALAVGKVQTSASLAIAKLNQQDKALRAKIANEKAVLANKDATLAQKQQAQNNLAWYRQQEVKVQQQRLAWQKKNQGAGKSPKSYASRKNQAAAYILNDLPTRAFPNVAAAQNYYAARYSDLVQAGFGKWLRVKVGTAWAYRNKSQKKSRASSGVNFGLG